ncbi:MAG: hypothetical protein U5K79_01185 [Cyclobacteriaceae bacterium]|nr:hypothetical protein [Cyclobacteriaceae bacterium]
MGTWDTGLSSNDIFADVYDEFFELYNEGLDVEVITANTYSKIKKELFDGQSRLKQFLVCECKGSMGMLSRWTKKFTTGSNISLKIRRTLELWRELGADDKDINKRDKVLVKFLEQLSQKKEKPKSRIKKKILNPIFEKGKCITFKLLNGNFGAALILEALSETPYGFNLVALTDINKKERPTCEDILKSNVLKLNYGSWENKVQISWMIANHFKKDSSKFEEIGKIQINKTYNYNINTFSTSGDWSIWLIEVASDQFEKGSKSWFSFGKKIKKYL